MEFTFGNARPFGGQRNATKRVISTLIASMYGFQKKYLATLIGFMMPQEWPPLPPARTGIRGLCPRCGEGHLFDGLLTLKPRCEACGLDYTFADPADGPAFFVICFTCVPAVAVACWIEVAFEPSVWVHLFTSVPLLLLACILPLRPLKGWLVNSQYFFKAEEGKIDRDYIQPRAAVTAAHNPSATPQPSAER